MSSGETCLDTLLRNMNPQLNPEVQVFVTTPEPFDQLGINDVYGCYRESEGITYIVKKKEMADQYGLTYSGVWRCITLNIHSDLTAVGFTAGITHALTLANIPCNVVAAFYHDHIYVPETQAQESLDVLFRLQRTVP